MSKIGSLARYGSRIATMKFTQILTVCTLLLTLMGMRAAAATGDPRAIFAQVEAASGGTSWEHVAEIHDSGKFTGFGLSGTYDTWIDTRTGRTKGIITLPGAVFGRGSDDQGPWQQTGGIVQTTKGPAALKTAMTAAYVCRNGWFHESTDPATFAYVGQKQTADGTFDVIDIQPKGGDPLEVWVDASSHLIHMYTDTDDNHQVYTTTLSDYRRIDGIMYPYSQRAGNGDPKFDAVTTAASVVLSPEIVAADLARPQMHAAGTLDGGAPARVRFTLSTGTSGHILLSATINGKGPMHFIFDTGGLNIITPEAAKRIAVQSHGTIPVAGSGENKVMAGLAKISELRIGGARLADQQFIVLPIQATIINERHDVPIDGVVGFEFLKNFAITIDYERRIMTFANLDSFVYDGHGTGLNFTTDGHTPLVHATIEGVDGTFWLDTGNGGGLVVFKAFLKAHSPLDHARQGLRLISPGGIGGTDAEFDTRVRSLSIGPYKMHEVDAAITNQSRGAFASQTLAGNLGSQILTRFTLTFDYPKSIVYFEPNADFGKPFIGDDVGFDVTQPDAHTLKVLSVAQGTPAANVGLRAGDIITSIDGKDVKNLGSDDFAMRLRGLGPVTLSVVRNGRRLSFTFVRRELIPARPGSN
jgi:hypothetical protein